MHLDVRKPLGLLFLILGVILTGYGLISDKSIYVSHSLGYNINLLWGLVFTGFGAAVLVFIRKQP